MFFSPTSIFNFLKKNDFLANALKAFVGLEDDGYLVVFTNVFCHDVQ